MCAVFGIPQDAPAPGGGAEVILQWNVVFLLPYLNFCGFIVMSALQ